MSTPPFELTAKAIIKLCKACNAELLCGPQFADGACWCDRLPNVMPLLESEHRCLCPPCLNVAIQLQQDTAKMNN